MAGVRTNRFGNPEMLKMATQVKNRKTGDLMPIYKTYIEVGGTLLKVEISHSNKEPRKGGDGMWVKFTKVQRNRQSGFGGGVSQGGNYGGRF